MANGILIVAESKIDGVKKVSLQLASKSVELNAGLISAVIIGDSVSAAAVDLGKYGVSKVYTSESADLKEASPSAYTQIIVDAVKKADPAIVLFGATLMGKEICPMVAAKLGVSSVSDCIDLAIEAEKVVAKRPMYAGKVIASVESANTPAVLSIRPNSFPVSEPTDGEAEVEALDTVFDIKEIVKDAVRSTAGKVELGDASIIVSGGRGVGAPENFNLLKELASVLGAAVGASRSVVDAGWMSHEDQIGQTGKTVSPNLYIACGISGAIQHLAGMSTSKFVLAINKDPDAPIFKTCSYGIVGDLNEVLPLLTEEFKKATV